MQIKVTQSPTLVATAVPVTPTVPDAEENNNCWFALGVMVAIPNLPTISIVSPRAAVEGKV